jgi:hypothetical protein
LKCRFLGESAQIRAFCGGKELSAARVYLERVNFRAALAASTLFSHGMAFGQRLAIPRLLVA